MTHPELNIFDRLLGVLCLDVETSSLFFCNQEELELVRYLLELYVASKLICSPLEQGLREWE